MLSSPGKSGFPPLGTGLNSLVRIICGAAAITFGNGLQEQIPYVYGHFFDF